MLSQLKLPGQLTKAGKKSVETEIILRSIVVLNILSIALASFGKHFRTIVFIKCRNCKFDNTDIAELGKVVF